MEVEDHEALEIDFKAPANSDLLFAWLSPIEKKVDVRLRTNSRPKSPSETTSATYSPFLRAKSAIRRTFRGTITGGTPIGRRARGQAYKLRGAPD